MTDAETLRIHSIRKTIIRSQRVYLAVAVIRLPIVVSWMLLEHSTSLRSLIEATVGAFTWALIYIGLRRRRAWVIPYLRMSNLYFCVSAVASILYPATTGHDIVIKIGIFLSFLFFAHQISFFGKKPVRRYLEDEGLDVF